MSKIVDTNNHEDWMKSTKLPEGTECGMMGDKQASTPR